MRWEAGAGVAGERGSSDAWVGEALGKGLSPGVDGGGF